MEGDQCERENCEQEFGGFEGLGEMELEFGCTDDGDDCQREGTIPCRQKPSGIASYGVTW